MKRGRTYDLNNVSEKPPLIAKVMTNSIAAAARVAIIESNTVLCSLPKVAGEGSDGRFKKCLPTLVPQLFEREPIYTVAT